MTRQSATMGIMVSVLVILAAIAGVLTAKYQQPRTAPEITGLLWPEPETLSPFTLVSHENNPFTLDDLRGNWSLLFFGFTHCPDVCPISLAVMDKVQQRLEQTRDVRFVFVTVDPERDTPARMSQYLASFNPAFIGLGGSAEQIAGLTKRIGLPYFLDKTENRENYLVDHGASLFLVDPQGRLVGIFSAPHEERDVAERFSRIRAFIEDFDEA